jgi:hypothetical protein
MVPIKSVPYLADLVIQLEKAGDRYQRAIKHLGCLPAQEAWDRCIASPSYAKRLMREDSRLTVQEGKAMSDRVATADQELIRLSTEVARAWKRATGQSVGRSSSSKSPQKMSGRVAMAPVHPLALMLDALGVEVAPTSVKELARRGRHPAAKGDGLQRP